MLTNVGKKHLVVTLWGDNMSSKASLLRSVAESGYNVGFGAKRHFKTYDMLRFAPKLISWMIIFIGIMQLSSYYKDFAKNDPNASELTTIILIIIGIIGLIIDHCSFDKEQYNQAGIKLIRLFNELRIMYNQIKGMDENSDFSTQLDRLNQIIDEASKIGISEQLMFSGWLTHISFFGGETQIDWIDEQLNFNFFKDKCPISFLILLMLSGISLIVFLFFR